MRISNPAQQQLELELLSNHAIDLSNYVDGVITLGCDQGWQDALELQAERAIDKLDPNGELSQGEYASQQRSIYRSTSKKRIATPANNWNLYGVHLDREGNVIDELAFFGQRLHPSNRPTQPKKNLIKFDASGVRSSLYLPPITEDYAAELLSDYGFNADEKEWTLGQIWEWIFAHPEVSLWVEESALKALASTSGGQLAIGLNGINCGGQKDRSDLLCVGLAKLAKGGRRITVRFDNGESSEKEAQRLSRMLNYKGANAGWWCYLSHGHKKTDDYMAAIIRGECDPIIRQDYGRVVGEAEREPYSRLRGLWEGLTIHREFTGDDIVEAFTKNRIVALRGATGTAKSKAILAAVELLESKVGQKLSILGLYCRSSLVHKGAYEFGVRSLSAPLGSAEREFGYHEGRVMRDGLFCCPESIHKPNSREETLSHWSHQLLQQPRNVVLVLDELSQTMLHLLLTGTDHMPMVRRECIQSLERLIQNPCVRVIAAEASLGDLELTWLGALSQEPPFLIQSTLKRPKQIYIGSSNKTNISILRALMGRKLKRGEIVWCGFGINKLAQDIHTLFKEHYKSLLINGENSSSPEVSAFVSDVESIGPQYQLLLFSPAISSGLSMAKTTVGLSSFVQQYAVPPEDALQAINRCRDSQSRILLMQKTAAQALIGTKQTTFDAVQRAYLESATAGQAEYYVQALEACSRASLEYAIALEARANYEARNNEHVLRSRLVEDGYEIRDLAELRNGEEFTEKKSAGTRLKRSEKKATLRQILLRDLCANKQTLSQACARVKETTRNGLVVDLRKEDPSEAFEWLTRLCVDELSQLSVFNITTPECQSVINAMKGLNRKEAARVKRLFDRVDVLGPDDKAHMGPIKTLLWHAGYHAIKANRASANGLYNFQITPIED